MKIKFRKNTPKIMKKIDKYSLSEYVDCKFRNHNQCKCKEITLCEIAKFGTKSRIYKKKFSINYTLTLSNDDDNITIRHCWFKGVAKDNKKVVKFLDKYSKYILEAFGKNTISFKENLVCSDVWHINVKNWLDNRER